MIRRFVVPGLLDTGPVHEGILAVRDAVVNFYVLRGAGGLICIDAGWRPVHIARQFAALGLDGREVVAVFLTHLHWDHARGVSVYPNAECFVGEGEPVPRYWMERNPDRRLAPVRDGQALTVAGLSVRVVATPGHTAGSVSYVVGERHLFTGDALRLRRGEARPFWAAFNADRPALLGSLRQLARLDQVHCVLTAHTGLTCDPARAFRSWRGAAAKVPQEDSAP